MKTEVKVLYLLLVIITVLIATAGVAWCISGAEKRIDSLQEQVEELQGDVDRSHKGGVKVCFLDYDIETALGYLKNGEDDKLLRYCEINDLNYTALVDLLISKGFLEPKP